uniref:Maxadilan n=1 Tax=Lutzomyia longipalpis TaxID=7200 RepID=MAXA_LUTLO|nr:RecName: Full=Maxadilan; Flags: Precursor [Lutzomyia longipalpis]AAA29288.1 maxadilan [Lutzomyia longipalpis]
MKQILLISLVVVLAVFAFNVAEGCDATCQFRKAIDDCQKQAHHSNVLQTSVQTTATFTSMDTSQLPGNSVFKECMKQKKKEFSSGK